MKKALLILTVALLASAPLVSFAQLGVRGGVHYQHSADMPPGLVGRQQLVHGGPRPNYFQPVEIWAPKGAQISLVEKGRFSPSQAGPVKASMLIGQVYRIKITNIPGHEGFEVYPSIELVNRLYPPHGLAAEFPIPVHFTKDELAMALAGAFVTRVVYLEEPTNAVPVADTAEFQRWYDVGSRRDPLQEADRLGRPMAILRMGSRIPDGAEQGFAFGSPPLIRLKASPPLNPAELNGVEPGNAEAAGDAPIQPAPAAPGQPVPPAEEAAPPITPPAMGAFQPSTIPAPRRAGTTRIPTYDQQVAAPKAENGYPILKASAQLETPTIEAPAPSRRSQLPTIDQWERERLRLGPQGVQPRRRHVPRTILQFFKLPQSPASPKE